MLLLKCEPGNTLGPHHEMRNSDVILIITPKWRQTCYFEIILGRHAPVTALQPIPRPRGCHGMQAEKYSGLPALLLSLGN
jgi:hypothetical protein